MKRTHQNSSLETSANDGGYRHVLSIAIPMVLGNAAFTIMQFTDRILLARYSSEAIQASLPAGILTFTLVSFFAAVTGYSGTFVSQYHGAGDKIGCAKAFINGSIMSFLCIPFFLLMLPLCPWLMTIAGHPENLLAAEKKYSFWMILNGLPLALHWVINGYLVGRGKATVATIVTTIGCALNILLDILLIFGKCGCPEMGIEGAALATFLASAIQDLMLIVAIFADADTRALPWRKLLVPDWPMMGRIARFGLPAGFTMLSDCGSFAAFALIVGRLDPLSLATSNIVISVNSLAISPLVGLGNATAVLVGQCQGACQNILAKKAGWKCLHIGFAYMLAIAMVFICFDQQILGAFRSPDSPYSIDEMIGLGKILLIFCICWGLFDTMNVVLSGGLRGAGDTNFVFLTILIGGWVFWVPSEIIVMFKFGGTIISAWVLMLILIISVSFAYLWRWCGNKWMSIDLLGATGTAQEAQQSKSRS